MSNFVSIPKFKGVQKISSESNESKIEPNHLRKYIYVMNQMDFEMYFKNSSVINLVLNRCSKKA